MSWGYQNIFGPKTSYKKKQQYSQIFCTMLSTDLFIIQAFQYFEASSSGILAHFLVLDNFGVNQTFVLLT